MSFGYKFFTLDLWYFDFQKLFRDFKVFNSDSAKGNTKYLTYNKVIDLINWFGLFVRIFKLRKSLESGSVSRNKMTL